MHVRGGVKQEDVKAIIDKMKAKKNVKAETGRPG